MSQRTVTAHPPNALVIIEDIKGGDAPSSLRGSLIASTDTCIAVGCSSEDETTFTIGKPNEVDPKFKPSFFSKVKIKTPSKILVVRSSYLETILEASVENEETTVWIWGNDAVEPNEINLGLC